MKHPKNCASVTAGHGKFSSTFFKRWWGVGGKAPKVATLRKERISQERQKRAARKGKGRGRA